MTDIQSSIAIIDREIQNLVHARATLLRVSALANARAQLAGDVAAGVPFPEAVEAAATALRTDLTPPPKPLAPNRFFPLSKKGFALVKAVLEERGAPNELSSQEIEEIAREGGWQGTRAQLGIALHHGVKRVGAIYQSRLTGKYGLSSWHKMESQPKEAPATSEPSVCTPE